MVELIMAYNPDLRPLGSYRLRMGLYLALSLGYFFLPFPWLLLPFGATGLLGKLAGIRWGRWAGELKGFWFFILLGPLMGWPWGVSWSGPAALWELWSPSWTKAASFLGILAVSHWLTATTTVLEIQEGLEALFRPLGTRLGESLGLIGSLTLSFLPWTGSQVRSVTEALTLRGVNRKKQPVRWILGLGLPVTVGLLEKSRHTAEALALRSSGERTIF